MVKDKEAQKIINRYFSKNFPPKISRNALLQLRSLNQARTINDLQNLPSNHLEKLLNIIQTEVHYERGKNGSCPSR
jgi:plasmid maintenance system killer protein